MPIPSDADIDLAVPAAGIPVRSLTNAVLKAISAVLRAALEPLVLNLTPIEGETINIPNQDREIIINLAPAGKFVRIRSGSITGTASVAINATQQEVLQ